MAAELPCLMSFEHSNTVAHYLGEGWIEGSSGLSLVSSTLSRQVLRIFGSGGFARRPVPDITEVVVGMRFRGGITGFGGEILQFVNSSFSVIADLYFNAGTGQVSLRRGSTVIGSTTTSFLDTFHYLEIEVGLHDSTGDFSIRVNGTQEDSASGIDTMNTTGPCTYIQFRGQVSTGNDYTDIYIRERVEAAGAGFYGPIINRFAPSDTDVTEQFTPDSGASNVARVNETPASTASYVDAASGGLTDEYSGATLADTGAVKCIVATAVVGRPFSGTMTLQVGVNSNGTPDVGTARTLTDAFGGIQSPYELNPDGSVPWTTPQALPNFRMVSVT